MLERAAYCTSFCFGYVLDVGLECLTFTNLLAGPLTERRSCHITLVVACIMMLLRYDPMMLDCSRPALSDAHDADDHLSGHTSCTDLQCAR